MTNRILALVTFGCLIAGTSEAQRFTGTIKIGTSHSTFIGDLAGEPTSWDRQVGLAGGGGVGIEFRERLGVTGELMYQIMGAETNVFYQDFPSRLISRSSYLAVPVLLQFRMGTPATYTRPRIFMGPAAMFAMQTLVSVSLREDNSLFFEQDDSIESMDYGLVLGLGFDIEALDQTLTIEARYYRGYGDVTKPSEEVGDPELLNNTFLILAGVSF